jgi:hypothetical protein
MWVCYKEQCEVTIVGSLTVPEAYLWGKHEFLKTIILKQRVRITYSMYGVMIEKTTTTNIHMHAECWLEPWEVLTWHALDRATVHRTVSPHDWTEQPSCILVLFPLDPHEWSEGESESNWSALHCCHYLQLILCMRASCHAWWRTHVLLRIISMDGESMHEQLALFLALHGRTDEDDALSAGRHVCDRCWLMWCKSTSPRPVDWGEGNFQNSEVTKRCSHLFLTFTPCWCHDGCFLDSKYFL